MPDKRTLLLARGWYNWAGVQGAAELMGVSEDVIREWLKTPTNPPAEEATGEVDEKDAAEKQKRRRYTPEEKAEALRLAAELGPSKASRQTGISIASLMKWRQA